MPHRVHQGPGYQAPDAGSIRHHAGMDPADAVLIIVGKGQRLQVVEGFGSQVAVDRNLGLHRAVAGNEVHTGSEEDQRHINQDIPGQRVQRAQGDKVVERVTLKHGHQDVHAGTHQAADNHPGQGFPVPLQIGEETGNAEERQRLVVVFVMHGLFHYAFTSSL